MKTRINKLKRQMKSCIQQVVKLEDHKRRIVGLIDGEINTYRERAMNIESDIMYLLKIKKLIKDKQANNEQEAIKIIQRRLLKK